MPRLRNPELHTPMLSGPCQEPLPDFLPMFSFGQTDFSIPLTYQAPVHLRDIALLLLLPRIFSPQICTFILFSILMYHLPERPLLSTLSKISGKVALPSEIYLVASDSVVPSSQVVLDFSPPHKTNSQLSYQ